MASDILEWPAGRLDFSTGSIVMGILNVTPDSFSDGGQFLDANAAVAHGLAMAEAGAAIIDVGPESTRPGSEAVEADEQIRRAVPVIEKLAADSKVVISIDTRYPDVTAAAIDAGADMINDVTALADDRMAQLAADRQVPVVLMHMKGTPATMQQAPHYDDVVAEVLAFLLDRAERARCRGIAADRIFIDPGIGFGKTAEDNLELLRNLDRFVGSGYRVLLGTSRKRFIGRLTGRDVPADRVFGTAATVALAVAAGVSIVRVHDVPEMMDVVRVANALR
ncbi:MAG: dihydropteroate synthase [Phycisphaerae bacterium]|nr:dihydropteroate synthase [Phycisphaerae bacterium]